MNLRKQYLNSTKKRNTELFLRLIKGYLKINGITKVEFYRFITGDGFICSGVRGFSQKLHDIRLNSMMEGINTLAGINVQNPAFYKKLNISAVKDNLVKEIKLHNVNPEKRKSYGLIDFDFIPEVCLVKRKWNIIKKIFLEIFGNDLIIWNKEHGKIDPERLSFKELQGILSHIQDVSSGKNIPIGLKYIEKSCKEEIFMKFGSLEELELLLSIKGEM